ncbi:MAG: ABC transporter permease subunit [Pseudomonadota bacterium]
MKRVPVLWVILGAAAILMLAKAVGLLPEWLNRLPETAIPPTAEVLDVVFAFVQNDLGLIYVTRWFAEGPLEFLLNTTANLLEGKRRWPNIGPIPWPAITAAVTVLAYTLGGWRLATLALVTCLWTALIGQWELAMQTLSVIAIAAPLAFFAGLALGIQAWRSPRFDAALKPLLSIMQTLPFFTYLLPAVIFFKVGPTAGAMATILYAMPPMILMTTLGLQKVSPEVVEAGKMSGSTRWQMLRHVYIPAARTDILVGVNQVIMLCLAMVVLTAFIGMPGLGAKLLSNMGSFRLGGSFEIGVTIVLIAILLDRMSKAWVVKQPEHFERGTPWWQRNKYLLIALVLFVVFCLLSLSVSEMERVKPVLLPLSEFSLHRWVPAVLYDIHRTESLSQGREIDGIIKGTLAIPWINDITEGIRWFLNVQVLIPFRNSLLWIPTPAFILLVVALAYKVGGTRPAIYAAIFFTIVAFSGWWDRSVITLYAVISAVVISMLVGIPLGVFAARSPKWSGRILLACDTAQTFPSFIYLIPAIMLFGVNDVAVVFAIMIFTTVPLTRYTIEGLRNVPPEIIEAADMSGTTRRQRLWKVEMPLALPTMAVGFNQAIMFAFFMVIIAAFIGTQDLGQELQRTLAGTDLGKNIVLGLNVSLMALTFDMAILAWAARRKKALGL